MRRPSPRTLFYVALALFATAPAWIVHRPPTMDLPFHLATTRIIHDLHAPAYGFDQDFVLRLGSTQYIVYYLAASALAYVLGVHGANVALVGFYLGGTVLALRELLRALGKDERLCLFAVPLVVNVLFLYGLFPFLIGIPLMLYGLALAVRHFEDPRPARAASLAVVALVLFYCHVFPFGVFAIGFAAMFPWRAPRRWPRAALPVLPAAAILLWWTLFTEAGRLSRGALGDTRHDPHKRIGEAIAHVHEYFIDIFKDASDDALFIALGLVLFAAFVLAQGDRERAKPVLRAYGLVPAACVLLYFTTPDAHDYIAIISQRFPIVFAITAIPLVRMPRGWRGGVVSAAALALGVFGIVNACTHFAAFEREEVGDFDGALAQMEPKRHVCALIFDRASQITNLQPFLHFGSYYQAEKGGVVEFTYAGYAHWPVDFKPGRYPPPGAPARRLWEWEPEKVPIDEIYPYYDYVLTRGEGFAPPPGTYRVKWRSTPWTVWEREGAPAGE